jgi:uncharacterized protein (TIGR02271 family)
VVPVVEERIRVETHPVETGRVQVRKTVSERAETVNVPLLHEELHVERRPLNLPVDGPPPGPREEGDTLIVPVLEEVLYVEKRLVVREEWRIERARTQRIEPREVVLRAETVEVVRLDGANPPPATGGVGAATEVAPGTPPGAQFKNTTQE